MQWVSRAAFKRIFVFCALLASIVSIGGCLMIGMPGKSFRGPLPAPTKRQQGLASELERDVRKLSEEIGQRNAHERSGLADSLAYLEAELKGMGYVSKRVSFQASGTLVHNVEVELPGKGTSDKVVVVGAHYDSTPEHGCPAADDNATGVAATLALARVFAGKPRRHTIRFVFFVNEEPPFFQTELMGSWVYARHCKARGDDVIAMLSLECMGYFSDAKGSQAYPKPLNLFYPSEGNFIAFVGNVGSRPLVRRAVKSFREHARFPSEGAALPSSLPGVGWSDHWAFWQEGYPAIMVTDTAPFRNPHYHEATDTIETLDFDRFARVTEGLESVIDELAGGE